MARSDIEILNAEITSYCSRHGIAAWERIRAKYIKEARPTARAKRPVQQANHASLVHCQCYRDDNGHWVSSDCGIHRGQGPA